MQEHTEEVADRVGTVLGEALGTIATLKQKGLTLRNASELSLQLPRLTGKNQWWEGSNLLLNLSKLIQIRIERDLLDWLGAPAIGAPSRCHSKLSKNSSRKVHAI